MNRLRFTSLGYFLLSFLFILNINELFAKSDKFRCMWRDDPATTMVIGWNQVSGTNPKVYYDEYDFGDEYADYNYSQAPDNIIKAKEMNNHFARLTGLRPNTIYYFIVVDSNGASKKMSFKTMPYNPDTRLSIIAGGDSRNNRKSRNNPNLLVAKLRPDCVLFAGDMTGGDTGREWREWFDDWQNTIGKDGRLTPIVVARGNHEYSNRSLIELFDVKEKGLYYGFTFGGDLLRVITLNSLIAADGEQKDWLRQDLKESQHIRWKFAQYHFPTRPHTARKSERNPQLHNWANLFYYYKMTVAIECDAHVVKTTYPIRPSTEPGSDEGYIRDDIGGTVYVGEGCWGAPLRRNNDDKKWTRASGSFNQFKWIFVDKYKVEIRTIQTNNAVMVGELYDDNRFTFPKNISIWNPPTGDVVEIFSKEEKKEEVINFVEVPRQKKPSLMLPQSVLTVADKDYHIPKPVQVFDYVAVPENLDVTVKWLAKNEPKGMIFNVERSIDTKQYKVIARINALESKIDQTYNTYGFSDKDIGYFSSKVYYRLSKVLPNSAPQIYKTISINNDNWAIQQPLVPDESGQVKIQYSVKTPSVVIFTLYDEKQKEVLTNKTSQQTSGNYLKSFNFQELPKGKYLLSTQVGNTIKKELILIE